MAKITTLTENTGVTRCHLSVIKAEDRWEEAWTVSTPLCHLEALGSHPPPRPQLSLTTRIHTHLRSFNLSG